MARHLMAAAVLLMAAGIAGAQAEDYPARTVTIIVPFAAGGPADITGRIVADICNHHLGQKFVVENAGGAGGSTHRATETVIASAAKQSILPQ
jgi:tripartite-type tricarboxylate transporter receptor subunit TctC